jgi:hypothetical protein
MINMILGFLVIRALWDLNPSIKWDQLLKKRAVIYFNIIINILIISTFLFIIIIMIL